MKTTTISSQQVYLLYYAPNWAEPVDCQFSILSDSDRGLTGKEDRTALSFTLRTSMSFSIDTVRETASEFRNALKELANDPVLCPFWPAQSGYADTNKDGVSAGLWVVWEPLWDVWEIYLDGGTPGSFTPSSKAQKAPLLWGRFDTNPVPKALTDEVVPCAVSFIDNSPAEYALVVDAQAFEEGPDIDSVPQNMFPLLPNWATDVGAGEAKYEIVKDEIGFSRQTADAYYDQDGARKISQTFAGHGWGAIKKALRFFYDKQGIVGRFWIPSAVAGCRLISEAAPPDTVLSVDNASGIRADDYIALISGSSVSGFEVASIDTGADTITLSSSVDRMYSARSSTLTPLVLARFETSELEVQFITDELAVVETSFIEVPKEYAEADSGGTLPSAYLYEFTLENYDVWRFTSHEQDITDLTSTWEAQQFQHSDVRENVNMEKSDVKITSRIFQGNPLKRFIPLTLESVLYVAIKECSPDDTGTITQAPVTIFEGSVSRVTTDGPAIEALCSGISALFDKMLPNILMQPSCNYLVFSTPCGLLLEDWAMSALVVEYPYTSGPETDWYKILVQPPSFSNPTPTQPRPTVVQFEHYFAGGKIEQGAGEEYQSRSIIDSDHTTHAPNVLLTIRHPLKEALTSIDSVNMWAGCDRRTETCKEYVTIFNEEGKFNNFPRFGGYPFTPIGNPSLAKVNKDNSEGGKK